MNRILIALIGAFLIAGCSSSKKSGNSLSDKEKENGWVLLFDGKTTRGWHTFGNKDAGNFWKVSDGMLYPDATHTKQYTDKDVSDLVTDETFGDFELQLDWRISEKGNSGILFYVVDNGKYDQTFVTGPEMQIIDNGTPIRKGHDDAKYYSHRAGDLYDLLASSVEVAKPQGEWNHIEIKCVQGKLDFNMNGVHTLSTTLWNDYWDKMINVSKFKYMPDFAKARQGSIALQFHGELVWFRNIKIRKL